MSITVLKANILHAPVLGKIAAIPHGYIVAEAGRITGVYEALPAQYNGAPITDYGDQLLIPAFSDLHLHAPQYAMLGLGMDLPLLPWLNTYTFPTEAKFADVDYAREVYAHLARALVHAGTTRVSIFASLHKESTHALAEALINAGITGYVGLVNMDRNSPDTYRLDTADSIADAQRFVHECRARYKGISPILTPRFTPSCTDELMQALGRLALEEDVRVQSHLSENKDEINWVRELCPGTKHYYESYARAGLWRQNTLMAHCIYSGGEERAAMKEAGVWAVHCPDSNVNIASGIAPVRQMLSEGLQVALGSDIAGGAHISMAQVTTAAIRASKQRHVEYEGAEAFLTFAEAFYLATSAGARYFGAGPGFQAGDALHALVLDDSMLLPRKDIPLAERLERIFYLAPVESIVARYAEGKLL